MRLKRYHCRAEGLVRLRDGGWSLAVWFEEGRPGGATGRGRTSKLRWIDFEHGVAVTQNSVYIFDPLGLAEGGVYDLGGNKIVVDL